ncbi:TPM domain-containing protein [Sphingomonas antarctica]|uniref:TPM domain-containing protein n=1 Tax=Sphingomonas antarctica TaxID=2040274 RepID=UPI0039EBA3A1
MTFWRALLAAWLALLATAATAQNFPKFTGLVVDDANVLSPQTEADLTAKLQALQRDTKRQVVVATIADLQGYPLEDYGYKLGRAWGVGLKDVDNGVILFIAPNNPQGQRGPRIEVGRGLEPIMTDALSSVIINQSMMPRLKAGDVDGAMTAGTDQIVAQLRASPEEAQARLDAATQAFDRAHQRSSGGGGVSLNFIFVILVILFGFVFPMIGRVAGGRRYSRGAGSGIGNIILWSAINGALNSGRSSGGGGMFGGDGGGGSSGGWGGGGFSGGGGGGFGGGGASGSW